MDVHGTRLRVYDFGRLHPPGEKDFELAQHLPPEVINHVRSFLKGVGLPSVIGAARFHKEFILLEVPTPDWNDAASFYVYSVQKHQIVGVFGWYAQG